VKPLRRSRRGAKWRGAGKAREALARAGFGPIDYVELRDAETLAPVETPERPARLFAAHGSARRG
jgi:pantoate--beta-alanine ligase